MRIEVPHGAMAAGRGVAYLGRKLTLVTCSNVLKPVIHT